MKISTIPYMILLSAIAIMPSSAKDCSSLDTIADGKAVTRMDLIDKWLESQAMNCYGDAEDTAYMGGTPLFDESTGQRKERYAHLLEKFPDEPWLEMVGNANTDAVDKWLESQSLNEYGDPIGTQYLGTSPLWDEKNEVEKDRYEYLLEKFPHEPWMVTLTSMDIIDNWLKSQSLNEYGDPYDTVYAGGSPLWQHETGGEMDRYEYLLEKFPDKPWVQDLVLMQSAADPGTQDRADPDLNDSPNANTSPTSGGFATQVSITSLSLSLFLIFFVTI